MKPELGTPRTLRELGPSLATKLRQPGFTDVPLHPTRTSSTTSRTYNTRRRSSNSKSSRYHTPSTTRLFGKTVKMMGQTGMLGEGLYSDHHSPWQLLTLYRWHSYRHEPLEERRSQVSSSPSVEESHNTDNIIQSGYFHVRPPFSNRSHTHIHPRN